MQQYQLTLKANKRPETLERVLRVVRHRGFEVVDLQAVTSAREITITLRVQSPRELALLTTQLEKLFDVISIN